MGLWRALPLWCIFPFISGLLLPSANHLMHELSHEPLCEMGCKCSDIGEVLFSMLDCSTRGIVTLPPSLHIDPSVSTVNLEGNFITNIHMRTFSVADTVEQLDLSSNRLEHIDNFTFTPFKALTLLRLSHNKLEELSPGVLEGLSNLRVLEAGHNSLQRLRKETFEAVPALLELRVQYNPLFDLPGDLFEHVPKLQRLDLQDTGLVLLPTNLFVPTQDLQWLSLSDNGFENVPEGALAQAPILESLDLSGNDFTSFMYGDFIDLSKLSLLFLNNLSRLTRIEKDAFVGLDRLNSFSCSFNSKLVYVDEEAFGRKNSTLHRATPHQQLYLRQNALSTLKSPLEMATWSKLSFVDFADNPWKCDCNLQWMRHLKKETQMNIVCASPAHLKGRPFHTVGPADLECQDSKWALPTFILTMSVLGGVGLVVLAASAVVCSRTPPALYVRAKKQFSYGKVDTKADMVDLEWDPSADI